MRALVVGIGLCLLLSVCPVLALDEGEPARPQLSEDTILQALEDQKSEGGSASGPIPPATPVPLTIESLDEASREALFERYRRYQQHHISMLEHRERLFRWQLTANQISFWMVLVLVFSGLVFAGIQFRTSMLAAKETGGSSDVMQELTLGAQGITIRSSVIGLVILGLSLGFFYLYLVYVFPLDELEGGGAGKAAATESADRAE
ncbi:MAG: hypothetical protein MPN21_17490 [Thermoanaerobaculia bacterium]|nr:hypothetical protein [Thermoanaerobaculia bacterium]